MLVQELIRVLQAEADWVQRGEQGTTHIEREGKKVGYIERIMKENE